MNLSVLFARIQKHRVYIDTIVIKKYRNNIDTKKQMHFLIYRSINSIIYKNVWVLNIPA